MGAALFNNTKYSSFGPANGAGFLRLFHGDYSHNLLKLNAFCLFLGEIDLGGSFVDTHHLVGIPTFVSV